MDLWLSDYKGKRVTICTRCVWKVSAAVLRWAKGTEICAVCGGFNVTLGPDDKGEYTQEWATEKS